jgi:geranylgeranyl pyrophosphate synthase
VNESTAETLERWRKSIDLELGRIAARHHDLPSRLRDAIQYSLTGEGKRLRGLLLMASYAAVRGGRQTERRDASHLAAAIEVVHAYSLVHDDLPCMDNDNLRWGMASTHRAFAVATATGAGVALVPLAVQQVLWGARCLELDGRTAQRLVGVLMHASGASGMVGGQLLDLEAEGLTLSVDQLEVIHRGKTGALIEAGFAMGGIAGGANESAVSDLRDAGASLGLAFQIADDVLDATESSEALGKTAGHDAALAKSTYASVLGVSAARNRSDDLVGEAMASLEAAQLKTPALEQLAHFVAARRS